MAEYEYDSVGNRTQVTYGNNTYQTFGYEASDPRWRLDNIHYFYKCDTQIEDQGGLKFTRDDVGNPTKWGNLDGKYTRVYSYDENSRLDSANLPGAAPVDYVYDWVGNRQDTDFSYNAADQLVSRPEHTYQYDDAGNMTYDNSVHYTYTFSGLLSTAGSSSMVWDAAGNRISFTSSTDQSHPYTFVYDITARIPSVIAELQNSTSVYYVREPKGALIARVSGNDTQYYHSDDLGSTVMLTGADGTVSDKYAYDAWGNRTSYTGSTNQPYQYVGQYGYYTHYQDDNLPLLQLGVRFYAPEIGRFTQMDPIASPSWSLYEYGRDNPLTNTDPSGRFPFWLRRCARTLVMRLVMDVPGDMLECIQSVCQQLHKGECGVCTMPAYMLGPGGGFPGAMVQICRTNIDRPPERKGKRWWWHEGRCVAEFVWGVVDDGSRLASLSRR